MQQMVMACAGADTHHIVGAGELLELCDQWSSPSEGPKTKTRCVRISCMESLRNYMFHSRCGSAKF